jgi:hypothetical protein
MKEPLWRKDLCWGTVISFFMLPSTAFILVIWSALQKGPSMLTREEIENFRLFTGYEGTLAALLFALAGFNTWDRRDGGKNQ